MKNEYLKNEDIERIYKETKKSPNISYIFWKILILEHIDNVVAMGDYYYEITENDIEDIVDKVMNSDYLWEKIDEEIGENLFGFRKDVE